MPDSIWRQKLRRTIESVYVLCWQLRDVLDAIKISRNTACTAAT
ncbi:hypothetical protein [Thalassovita taeanensis]|uniref:Uncharacterized protein n=1 Tax=Thalassovita taeanensis TaxID=657014 RepID=A0A1H9I3I7_9RHOB|nr:hypothetical protein [Thalassovita taeanensis]SEQ69241.1 hypothetical protein SAMN04488092_11131 [Thalassovita taeanensis]